ncbi:ABC transporter ATP-binding protein/permease [Paraglaciecola aquimarina]|uniref:ABC transporter ATP-binding protein/permease n=1 Tax=Paraglaciecola algarum TaxID=3050085 RepID=A0ABS9D7A3_9ALTE|nr:ABC transporter ATP-binding protein [Paraglaciecola sp. G1-23]MCF2947903.1 ABC transporter ATP-binding protein/permease [Paraglaciecola sp. G1-23]
MFSFFERLTNPFPVEHPTQPPKTLLAFCRYYTQGMWPAIFTVSLLAACIAALEVSLFGFLGQLVDLLAASDRQTFFAENRTQLIWMGALVLVVLPILVITQSLVSHQSLMGNFPMKIRWQAHRYVIGQSLGYFQNEFAGRVATKVMQTALAVRETVMKTLDIMVYVSVYFVSILFLVFSADWRLTAPLIIWFIVYLIILRVLIPKLKRVSQKQADARSMMTGRVIDSYTNITTVKLFAHTSREAEYAKEGMNGFLQSVYPQMRLATVLYGCVWFSNALLVFSISALAIYLWMLELVTPGEIAITISLCLRLNGMSQWVMWEVSSLFENIGTVQDGINSLSVPVEVKDQPEAKKLNMQGGGIHFDKVNFAYQGAGDLPIAVFKDLNIQIKPGEKVGLVGRSGAGKSTLVNLLLRFYDIQTGSIKIDGQDISQVQQESLRANISMVTQDTSLLHRSVRENILYGRLDASEEDMLKAAKQAESHEFIQSLSDLQNRTGYDAHVGERGVKLSGGQRQRIAIARVMLKDAPILILDEATSALDSEVEAAIQHCLNKVMENKTVLAIAHRLSTIAQMDRLLVLDKGRIVESGSHAELLEKGGIYAKLWEHQTGGFIGLE